MVNPDIIFGRLGNRLFQGAYLYAQMKEGRIPDIYAQHYILWEKYQDEIKQLFSEGIGSLPYVAIHLRRGANPINPNEPKYSENPYYVHLENTDYYQRAMELFPNERFLVFSDDLPFARNYFIGEQFIFDDTKDAVSVLNRMASCEGIIGANSSLSWWASFLSTGKLEKVLPKEWFSDRIERVGFPKKWLII